MANFHDEFMSTEFSEANKYVSDNYPKALRVFFNSCFKEGFSSEQAMHLVSQYFGMLLTESADRDLEEEVKSSSDSDDCFPSQDGSDHAV